MGLAPRPVVELGFLKGYEVIEFCSMACGWWALALAAWTVPALYLVTKLCSAAVQVAERLSPWSRARVRSFTSLRGYGGLHNGKRLAGSVRRRVDGLGAS